MPFVSTFSKVNNKLSSFVIGPFLTSYSYFRSTRRQIKIQSSDYPQSRPDRDFWLMEHFITIFFCNAMGCSQSRESNLSVFVFLHKVVINCCLPNFNLI